MLVLFSEYLEVKKTHSFFDICQTPEVACEVTLQVITNAAICLFLEFMEIYKQHKFFKLCETPELACELTLQVCLY